MCVCVVVHVVVVVPLHFQEGHVPPGHIFKGGKTMWSLVLSHPQAKKGTIVVE